MPGKERPDPTKPPASKKSAAAKKSAASKKSAATRKSAASKKTAATASPNTPSNEVTAPTVPAPAPAPEPTVGGTDLPVERPSRVIVEPVRPVVDGGRFASKCSVGRPLVVEADVFTDGHDLVAAALLYRYVGSDGPTTWREVPLRPIVNDRFRAEVVPDRLGRWEVDIAGWMAHAETWRRGTLKKIDAGQDVEVELEIGRRLVERMLTEPEHPDDTDHARLRDLADRLAARDASTLDDPGWEDVFFRAEPRTPMARLDPPLAVDVDPLVATFGSWYSFFPRSTARHGGPEPESPGTLRDAIDRLDDIQAMGFDVAYIPPVHPIGVTNRKGRDNATVAEPGDVGSPYAIGSSDGGHMSVAPELGTLDDFRALVESCRERGMHLALDIAFNCSPDHPWVTEHPEWFVTRPDGTIQYAENPPKKYEDIYPLDFETEDWQGLWNALADVFRFWIEQGVTIFRVDNPHTKAFAFWEWAIGSIRAEHPDVVFLSEAFTRPRVMERLAKLGFNQSYTYFAWRHSGWELREYMIELSTRTIDYLRPTFWPNTHDILTTQLQHGGRAGFVMRAVLAATLSPSWGVYGPVYELMETTPREGVEDYRDSEKYEVKHWDLDRPGSLAPLLTRLNAIRRDHPAFVDLESIHFHQTDNDAVVCYSKRDPLGQGLPVLVVVNLDPHQAQGANVDIDLGALGLPYGIEYDVVDRLGGATYRWSGNANFVQLAPWAEMAHVFTVHRRDGVPDVGEGR